MNKSLAFAVVSSLLLVSSLASAKSKTLYQCFGSKDGAVYSLDVFDADSGQRYVKILNQGSTRYFIVTDSDSRGLNFAATEVEPKSGTMLTNLLELRVPAVLMNKGSLKTTEGLSVSVSCDHPMDNRPRAL